jgi:Glycosyltransferase family 87
MLKIPYWAIGLLYVVAGIAAGLISWNLEQSQNLLVFLQSARDLLRGANLYELHTVEWYKYSPTFAICFVPFLWVPPGVAAAVWGAINFGAAYAGMRGLLANERDDKSALLLSLLAIAFVTDGDQANLLITGTMLLAYKALRKDRSGVFGLLTSVGVLVKIFPVVGLGMLVGASRRVRIYGVLWFLLTFAILFALPLLFMTPDAYLVLLKSWRALVAGEAGAIQTVRGWSILHMIQAIFHVHVRALPLQLFGAALLSVPFAIALFRPTPESIRLDFALSILMFVVLWNHRSEYCTLVVSAVAMSVLTIHHGWRRVDVALLVLAIVLTAHIFTEPNPQVKGPFGFLGARRSFTWFRLIPLTAIWLKLQVSLVRRLLAPADPARAG